MNILNKIIKNKKEELIKQEVKDPLVSFINNLKPSNRDFKKAIKNSSKTRPKLIAELKRSSPSAGIINTSFNINKIIKTYNQYASAISVLTDEKFFGGELDYLTKVSRLSNLPLLRKDFIVDEYQIYQARKFGADAILLIASILSQKQIDEFIKIAKKYKMDCLVEVRNFLELKKVLQTKTEIIGINNRNLKTFKIDINNTLKLAKQIPKDKIVVSESGITSYNDVVNLHSVDAILVGTSLMKSDNLKKTISNLLSPQIKICGLKSFIHAQISAKSGADFLGFIFVEGRARYIDPKNAKIIIDKIRTNFSDIKIVGVFQNEKINKVNEIAKDLNLDFVQLHSNESVDYCKKISKPIIKSFSVDKNFDFKILKKYKKQISYFLFDTLDGGRGKSFDWSLIKNLSTLYPIILSGGLSADNINQAISTVCPQVVDVSSGVEDKKGEKSVIKIRQFIKTVKH